MWRTILCIVLIHFIFYAAGFYRAEVYAETSNAITQSHIFTQMDGNFSNLTSENSADNGDNEQLRGRDFVDLGEYKELAGTLKQVKHEWVLITNESEYELHLGNHDHRAKTGIELEEGRQITAKGYVYTPKGASKGDIAVCVIILDNKEYRFRQDDGTPLWRGMGSRESHHQ